MQTTQLVDVSALAANDVTGLVEVKVFLEEEPESHLVDFLPEFESEDFLGG